ncbi:acetylcholinesterase-like [Glandiceps talaboti]
MISTSLIVTIYVFFTTTCTVNAGDPTVEISTGKLVGSTVQFTHGDTLHTVHVYKGIPYAEPPIGDLRFQPPVPKSPWSGEYDASYFRNICMQFEVPLFPLEADFTMGEDCLHLNVFAPQPRPTKAAVMVWIHGGGFVTGTSTSITNDGTPLAGINDVIVVTINYRLGVFGFLSTGDSVSTGNYGLLDQVLALQWVKENIGAFGGDADRVTIFGESAGSFSVQFHILSTLSSGLFHRAIMQSGSAVADVALNRDEEFEKVKAHAIGQAVGCKKDNSEELLECLMQVPAEDFIEPQDLSKGIMNEITGKPVLFIPRIDGHFLKEDPLDSLSAKSFNKVDTIMGTTADEGMVMLVMFFPQAVDDSEIIVNKTTFDAIFPMAVPNPAKKYPQIVDAAKMLYTNWEEADSVQANYAESYNRIITDQMFVCPTDISARVHYEAGLNVYLYQLDHHPSTSVYPASWTKTGHGEDLAMLFGFHLVFQIRQQEIIGKNWTFTAQEADMSLKVMKYFTNFAKTGSPNMNEDGTSTDIEWPKFTVPELQYKELSPSMPTKRALKARECAFWNQLVPDLIKSLDAVKAECEEKTEASTHDEL